MSPAEPRSAAPGAICPPVPDLPGGGGAGRAVVDGVVIGKHTDLATVPLVEACATGRHIERAVITLERGGLVRFRFLVVELEDVVVTRVNSSWSGGLPDEEVSLGFNRICWEYRRSRGADAVRFCFDVSR
jgi:type VI secretion system secreted protein Hcp